MSDEWPLIAGMYRHAFKAALKQAKEAHEAYQLPVGFSMAKGVMGGCAVRLEWRHWSEEMVATQDMKALGRAADG